MSDIRRINGALLPAACLVVSGLVGCATPRVSVPPATVAEIAEYTADPLDGVGLIEAPVVPASAPGQCVEYSTARVVADQQDAHLKYLEARAISAQGWRKLSVSRAISVDADTPVPVNGLPMLDTIEAGGPAFVERRDDRLIDEDGAHWIVSVADASCSSAPPPEFYVDGDEVFRVDVELECEIVEHASCGAWPADGCGTAPRYRRPVLVRVPPQFVKGEPRFVKIKTGQCVSYAPELGYSYPP